jgi:hypothetical protein
MNPSCRLRVGNIIKQTYGKKYSDYEPVDMEPHKEVFHNRTLQKGLLKSTVDMEPHKEVFHKTEPYKKVFCNPQMQIKMLPSTK